MNLYKIVRPILFAIEPELANAISLKLLKLTYKTGLPYLRENPISQQPIRIMGLNFKNPLGLAAGLDNNGDYIDPLSALGFGFIEIGTVTPKPQLGNSKPRIFRLTKHEAIINRLGFNNLGIVHLMKQVRKAKYNGILGINIGKNLDTPLENAVADYLFCMRECYALASYIVINISSPNTTNLRQLQEKNALKNLLSHLKEEQLKLQQKHHKYTPLVIKIAPDLTDIKIIYIANLLLEFKIDGVIATNTTVSRSAIKGHKQAKEIGGLSGTPLKRQATHVVSVLRSQTRGKIAIIATGGILSAKDAKEKLEAGASLVQIHSGLIFQGPSLIKNILQSIDTKITHRQ